jgi:hypothetical protein
MPLDGADWFRTADLSCSEEGAQTPGASLLPLIEEEQVLDEWDYKHQRRSSLVAVTRGAVPRGGTES